MRFKVYLRKRDINDATDFYVKILEDALKKSGYDVERVCNVKNIEKKDKVLTISSKAFFDVWIHNPKQYIINWFQGVAPEESLMLFDGKPQGYLRKLILSFLEPFALKKSKANFFVSKSMLTHYERKYKYKKDNYFLMPCFNQLFDENNFFDARYNSPNFLYAGSMAKWQCVDETLMLFKKIQEHYPLAKLTILTGEKDTAEKLLQKFNLIDVTVKHVPYQQLNSELKKYKYGFLLRKDIIVNNVATPTKMNSYLANGIIPIYSTVIHDFAANINSKYIIQLPVDNYEQECLNKLKSLEEPLLASEVREDFENIFKKYYSKDHYIKLLNDFFERVLK